jgi:hypothetical protein
MNKWLDNYGKEENANDSHVKLSQGFVGEGTINGPQWKSPAWSGQFQNGGKTPLYVESKNDPRYRAYQDSLSLYNYNKLQRKLENPGEENDSFLNTFGLDSAVEETKRKQKILEAAAKKAVKESDGRIKFGTNYNKDEPKFTKDRRGNISKNETPLEGYEKRGSWDIYNPNILPKGTWKGLAINEDYSNVKPQQQVIVNPITSKSEDIFTQEKKYKDAVAWYDKNIGKGKYTIKTEDWTDTDGTKKRGYTFEDTAKKEHIQGFSFPIPENKTKITIQQKRQPIKLIQNNLDSKGLVQSNFNLESSTPNIRPQAKLVKYFDVTDSVNQNFGGSESHYKYYPENGSLQELAPEPYNSRKMIPHYAMGGSLPGSVGFTYARTNSSAPSNGPYAKKNNG